MLEYISILFTAYIPSLLHKVWIFSSSSARRLTPALRWGLFWFGKQFFLPFFFVFLPLLGLFCCHMKCIIHGFVWKTRTLADDDTHSKCERVRRESTFALLPCLFPSAALTPPPNQIQNWLPLLKRGYEPVSFHDYGAKKVKGKFREDLDYVTTAAELANSHRSGRSRWKLQCYYETLSIFQSKLPVETPFIIQNVSLLFLSP